MKRNLFTVAIIALIIGNSAAQNFVLYSDKTFGGNSCDGDNQMLNIGNNEFIMAGVSGTDINGDKTDPICSTGADIWLVKVDTGYNIIWDKDLGGEKDDEEISILMSQNGKLIFSCESKSDSSCEKSENNRSLPALTNDYWICALDTNGNKIWDRTYGSIDQDQWPGIIELSTGGYIVAGLSSGGISGDKTVDNYNGSDDYWAIKLDTGGNKIWDKVYGGSGSEDGANGISHRFSLLACENGSFIIAGTSGSPVSGDVSDSCFGIYDAWIIKIDSAGNKIWDKRYGGSNYDYASQIIHTNDGYILVGYTDSPQDGTVSEPPISIFGGDVWVIKLDSLGNEQWDRRYGGDSDDEGVSIAVAPGGGYVISATIASSASFDVSEPSYGSADDWIFKIDNAGNKLWDKRFGGPGMDFASNFVIMPDTSIYLCGQSYAGTSAVKTDSGKGGADYWVVHFKYSDTATGIGENEKNLFSVYPNPTTGNSTFKYNLNGAKTGKLEIYTVLGMKVAEYTLNPAGYKKTISLPVEDGVYIYKVIADGVMVYEGKVLVVR